MAAFGVTAAAVTSVAVLSIETAFVKYNKGNNNNAGQEVQRFLILMQVFTRILELEDLSPLNQKLAAIVNSTASTFLKESFEKNAFFKTLPAVSKIPRSDREAATHLRNTFYKRELREFTSRLSIINDFLTHSIRVLNQGSLTIETPRSTVIELPAESLSQGQSTAIEERISPNALERTGRRSTPVDVPASIERSMTRAITSAQPLLGASASGLDIALDTSREHQIEEARRITQSAFDIEAQLEGTPTYLCSILAVWAVLVACCSFSIFLGWGFIRNDFPGGSEIAAYIAAFGLMPFTVLAYRHQGNCRCQIWSRYSLLAKDEHKE